MIAGIDFSGSLMYSNKSSAYKDTLCSVPALLTPEYSLAVRKEMARGSMASANSSGDKGQPCLVERPRGKKSEHTSFVRTEACG